MIIIKNACIITQNKHREIIKLGFIEYDETTGRIMRVGKGKIKNKFNNVNVIDIQGHIVIPGLINTHIHLGESVYQGFIPKIHALDEYLSQTEKISNSFSIIEKYREVINDYSLMNAILSGTTTYAGIRISNSCKRWDVRNVSGHIVMNSTKLGKFSKNIAEYFPEEFRQNNSMNINAIFLHSLTNTTDKQIRDVKNLFNKYSTILMVHTAETKMEEDKVNKKWQKTSIQVLDCLDLLNQRTLLIHCNFIDDNDIKIIRKRKANIIQCPSSNIYIGNKFLDLNKVIKTGILTAIGTDGIITSGTLNLLSEARTTYLMHHQSEYIPSQKILDMITIKPASILGMGDKIGSIETNKLADLVILNAKYQNNKDILHDILFYENMHEIYGVIVNGKRLVWGKKLINKDEYRIKQSFNKIQQSISTN